MKQAHTLFSIVLLAFLCLVVLQTPVNAQQAPPSPTPSPTPTPAGDDQPPVRQVDKPPAGFDRPLGATGPAQQLSVDDAVALALKQASPYTTAQVDEAVAAENVKQARAAFLPQISIPLTYFGTTPSLYRPEGEPRTFSYVSSSAINETIAHAAVTGEIDISGRLRATLQRNRELLAAAKAGTLVARRALVLNTVDAFYGLVLARQRRRLAEETLSLAEGFVKVVEGRAQRGEDESGGSDLIRARTQVFARRDELELARATEAAATDVLRSLTGVNYATPIDVTRIAKDLPTTVDFSSYTEELLRTRPELAALDAQKRGASADARAARSERLPQLSYSVNGGFDAGDFTPLGRYAGGSALVSLAIPVFDFGASKSRESQARLRARSIDLQREIVMTFLQQEFYTARTSAMVALTRIPLTEAGSNEAQRGLTLVFAQYRAKNATITDVVDAQAAYAAARMAYYQAIIDYRVARVRLEQDLGK